MTYFTCFDIIWYVRKLCMQKLFLFLAIFCPLLMNDTAGKNDKMWRKRRGSQNILCEWRTFCMTPYHLSTSQILKEWWFVELLEKESRFDNYHKISSEILYYETLIGKIFSDRNHIRTNNFVFLFSVYRITSLSRHEQICL